MDYNLGISIFSGQLKKALDENMLEKYQERLQEESISMAELPDLVKYVKHFKYSLYFQIVFK